MERLGSEYGSWVVPTDQLRSGAVCYCVGAGVNITFDLELARRFRCEVYTIDPMPRAKRHFDEVASGVGGLHFVPLGLWSSSGRMRFYIPPKGRSHSIVNLYRTNAFFEADCVTLPDLMARLGHADLDLLKMDIVGAEFEVLESMLAAKVPVRILCVAFYQPRPIGQVVRMVQRLREAGYRLLHIDGLNFAFLKTLDSEGFRPMP